jgi:hypothetical protein
MYGIKICKIELKIRKSMMLLGTIWTPRKYIPLHNCKNPKLRCDPVHVHINSS